MKQGTVLVAKRFFSLQKPNAKRRANIGIGERFVVTSPEYKNKETVIIDREKKAHINQGYLLSMADIQNCFSEG